MWRIIFCFTFLPDKHFELDSNPIQAKLTQSMPAVQLGGVQINHLGQAEGNQSFVMEIINVELGPSLSSNQGSSNDLFVHRILNRTEVVIVNNDGMLRVYEYE